MEEARKRQRWLLAAGLALALVPSRLADLSPPFGGRVVRVPAEAEPAPLALAAPDLVGEALRLEVGPSFRHREAPPEPSPRAPLVEPSTLAPLTVAKAVAEPPVGWLLGLSLTSAAYASRGTRRFPRWPRPR